MNLTIGNAKVSSWKNLKTQYIAAACGLALAAAAVTSFAATTNGTTLAPTNSSHTQPISVSQRGPSQHTIFIAGSERQAADQQASVFQDIDPSWYSAYSFIVASNADEEAHARFGLDEAAREVSGVSLLVIDLRTPLMQPIPSAVKSDEARRADALRYMEAGWAVY